MGQQAQLAPLRYVDDNAETTEAYPFNPNGSPQGIAALCSDDGRHLAMMPHPERAFLKSVPVDAARLGRAECLTVAEALPERLRVCEPGRLKRGLLVDRAPLP